MTPPRDETRPWGHFEILDDSAAHYKVKRMTILPGQRLSYQSHERRTEHWFIVHGTATVVLDDVEYTVRSGESIDVPLRAKHRCANRGDEDVVFIEVQRGDYFGEDDIVRYDDDYGRVE